MLAVTHCPEHTNTLCGFNEEMCVMVVVFVLSFHCSVRAQPEGTIQAEAEGGREAEQPHAEEKRWKHYDSLQEEGSGADG